MLSRSILNLVMINDLLLVLLILVTFLTIRLKLVLLLIGGVVWLRLAMIWKDTIGRLRLRSFTEAGPRLLRTHRLWLVFWINQAILEIYVLFNFPVLLLVVLGVWHYCVFGESIFFCQVLFDFNITAFVEINVFCWLILFILWKNVTMLRF